LFVLDFCVNGHLVIGSFFARLKMEFGRLFA
jgi:hypothetical protein